MKKTAKIFLASTALLATIAPVGFSSTGVILESQRALASEVVDTPEKATEGKAASENTVENPVTETVDSTPEFKTDKVLNTINNEAATPSTQASSTEDATASVKQTKVDETSYTDTWTMVNTSQQPITDVAPIIVQSKVGQTYTQQAPEGYLFMNAGGNSGATISADGKTFTYTKTYEGNEAKNLVARKISGFMKINYVDEQGNNLGGSNPEYLSYGDSYNLESPDSFPSTLDGEEYTLKDPSQKVISGTFKPEKDSGVTSINVVYKKSYSKFFVTLKALDFQTGKELLPTFSETVPYGQPGERKYYDAPKVEGMRVIDGRVLNPYGSTDISQAPEKIGVSIANPGTNYRPSQNLEYRYIPDDYSVIKTEFVDDSGNKLMEKDIQAGEIGTKRTFASPQIQGYKLATPEQQQEELTFDSSDKERKLEYVEDNEPKPATLTVRAFDNNTGFQLSETQLTGNTGESWSVDPLNFPGIDNNLWEFAGGNTSGTFVNETGDDLIVYVRKAYAAKVKFVDAKTGQEIAPSQSEYFDVNGDIDGSRTFKAPNIDGYTASQDEVSINVLDGSGGYMDTETVIEYNKDAVKTGTITVKYIDAKTGQEIRKSTSVEGNIGDEVTFNAGEAINGYFLDATTPWEITKTIAGDETYEFKYNKAHTTLYVDEEGNNLVEPIIGTEVGLPMTIAGFHLINSALNEDGNQVYTYAHNYNITFVDEDGKDIAKAIKDSEVSVDAKEIKGYKLVNTKKNGNDITYVYAKDEVTNPGEEGNNGGTKEPTTPTKPQTSGETNQLNKSEVIKGNNGGKITESHKVSGKSYRADKKADVKKTDAIQTGVTATSNPGFLIAAFALVATMIAGLTIVTRKSKKK